MFRITLRELLWLTLVVAACTGWYVNSRELPTLRNRVQEISYSLQLERLDHGEALRAYSREIERVSGRKLLGVESTGSPVRMPKFQFRYADEAASMPGNLTK